MVRKSDRNKGNAAAAAAAAATSAEKPTRKRRSGRRRKDSSSESETETRGGGGSGSLEENLNLLTAATTPSKDCSSSSSNVKNDVEIELEVSSGVETSTTTTTTTTTTSTGRTTRNRRNNKKLTPNKDETLTATTVNLQDTISGETAAINTTNTSTTTATPTTTTTTTTNEWNEDDSFWTGADDTSMSTGKDIVHEDEGSTWKIQTSNGSGGEIQKLKICRQRPTDSTGSSSPAKECASPRGLKSKTPAIGKSDSEVELDTPMEIGETLSQQSEIVNKIETTTTNIETSSMNIEKNQVSDVTEEQIIIPGLDLVGEGQQKQDQLWISNEQQQQQEINVDPSVSINELQKDDENVEIDNKILDTEEQEIAIQSINMETQEMEIAHESLEIELPKIEAEVEEQEEDEEETTSPVVQQQDGGDDEVIEATTTIATTPEDDHEKEVEEEEEEEVEDQQQQKVVEQEENIVNEDDDEEGGGEEAVEEVGKEMKMVNTGDGSEQLTDEKKKLPSITTNKCLSSETVSAVSTELAMEQIAKKLNERAARINKEIAVNNDEKEEKMKIKSSETTSSSSSSPPPPLPPPSSQTQSQPMDIDRSIEEGEIVSSAAATPDKPTPTSQAKTDVGKSEEVDCLPTKLKRNLEDFPPVDRQQPAVPIKRLSFSHQIIITSELLNALLPPLESIKDIQELNENDINMETVNEKKSKSGGSDNEEGEAEGEAVEEGEAEEGEADDDENENEEQKENIIINKTIKNEQNKLLTTTTSSKCNLDMEVTISNDVREVKKKIPIVIDTNEMTINSSTSQASKMPPGPKLPTQENHKATRKISIVSADAKSLRKSPSPSRKKATEVLFITNLVRPFTVPQLRELLARTGTIAQNGFYIDKIKSKCYVKYTDIEMAIETRHALHGVRWPINNPKTLRVDFASAEDMAIVQKLADEEATTTNLSSNNKKSMDVESATSIIGSTGGGSSNLSSSGGGSGGNGSGGWLNEQTALKSTRRVTTTVREWDMGKVVGGTDENVKISPPIGGDNKKKQGAAAVAAAAAAAAAAAVDDDWSSNRKKEKSSRIDKERDRRRPHSPEHKSEPPKKIKKKDVDTPAKLLNDLFRKTKATPCIYWLPLTAAQIAVKEEMRRQHMAEHERRLAELRKTDNTTIGSSSRRGGGDNKESSRGGGDRDRDRDKRKK